MTTLMIDSDNETAVERTDDVVRQLLAAGRAELARDEAQAARERAFAAEVKATARRAVIAEIKAAVVADGQVPAELFPFVRVEGLGDDGACPSGTVTVCIDIPGLPPPGYVYFNVVKMPACGRWYVKGEWIARTMRGSDTEAFGTFARAVAAAFDRVFF